MPLHGSVHVIIINSCVREGGREREGESKRETKGERGGRERNREGESESETKGEIQNLVHTHR